MIDWIYCEKKILEKVGIQWNDVIKKTDDKKKTQRREKPFLFITELHKT
jgi:hypothetical protein